MKPGWLEERDIVAPAGRDRRALLLEARRLTRLESPAAAQAWRSFLALDPHHVEALTRLAEAELYDQERPGARRARLAVVGNCQAYALAQCLRRLCPETEIRALSVGELGDPEEARVLAERFSGFDAVIGQPLGAKHGPLAAAALSQRARRFVAFPRLHFDGFQPDMVPASAYPRGMHSRLALAGFVMGLPEARVQELFNAYVYGVLGYFDACPKAELYLLESGRSIGFELGPVIEAWRAEGAFMHAPVHPAVRVSWSIAEELTDRLGLDRVAGAPDVPDLLAPLGVWPVYPEIAARLGLPGSLTFRFRDEPPMDLERMIARSYRACAALDRARIAESVGDVIETLRGEGV